MVILPVNNMVIVLFYMVRTLMLQQPVKKTKAEGFSKQKTVTKKEMKILKLCSNHTIWMGMVEQKITTLFSLEWEVWNNVMPEVTEPIAAWTMFKIG